MNGNNELIARAYLIGRYGMLQCPANISVVYGRKTADDDGQHRINDCEMWKDINQFTSDEKLSYSEDEQESMLENVGFWK